MISEFPLFLYTTLAGMAAGAYVARAIVPLPGGRKRPWLFALVCLVLLAVSGFALLGHLGHPERVLSAFSNFGAGIAQEGLTTILFGIAVVADLAFCVAKKDAPRWLVVVAAVLGVCMTVTMGLAYYAFVGTFAWAHGATVPLFIVGDLGLGAGFYLAFNAGAVSDKAFAAYDIAVQALAAVCVTVVGAHFAGLGYGIAPFAVGAVCLAAACVVAVLARKGDKPWAAWAICALAIVGVAVARYAFYMGSII